MPGDEFCRDARPAARRGTSAHGGWCQLLANWLHVEGEDWRERVAGWVPSGCDGWVVQREVAGPGASTPSCGCATPASTGTGRRTRQRYDAWLGLSSSAQGHRRRLRLDHPARLRLPTGRRARWRRWPQPVEQPLGDAGRRSGSTARRRALSDDATLLDARCRLADGRRAGAGRPARRGGPRAHGAAADPGHAPRGQVGTVEAALAGVCDGRPAARARCSTRSPSSPDEDPVRAPRRPRGAPPPDRRRAEFPDELQASVDRSLNGRRWTVVLSGHFAGGWSPRTQPGRSPT